MGQLTPPKTYFEWLDCIDQLGSSELERDVLACMQSGSLDWTSGVAERFVEKLMREINRRLSLASEWLTRDLNRAGGNEELIVAALLNVRRRFGFCVSLATLPALPHHVQEQTRQAVQEYLANAQKSMEESAASDRTGKFKSILRGNAITRAGDAVVGETVGKTNISKRGIIFK